jgi:c-di-GMP-binding flagellar brake protein YcgR
MKPRRILTVQDASEILDSAVREKALAVIAVQQDGGWQSLKCRFLEQDPNHRFFVLDYQSPSNKPLPGLQAGQYVGVSFRRKSRKVLFPTVVEATGSFLLDDGSNIPAIRLRWPESMTELQRRAYYRTPVPGGANLLANLWAGGRSARAAVQENTLQVITGEAKDISCGGALIRINQLSPPNWTADATVGVELHLPDGRSPLLTDAYYRGVRHDPAGNLCLAIQFVGLELMADGQTVLQRITRCVQQFNRLSFTTQPRSANHRFRE